ncbi:hypothetical protein DFR52_11419 [Hoeflea marina]|uniref:Uncharacterized protein n=1 Tax=Hoeflea marina TaxID=274592 RepID=A0A317PDU6_9HYPH|nr:hypothetical protein [Hoeflea marina]PWV95262.1 hypothetical protein DFR52_11419 [Hoeflea marina]
MTQTLSDDIRVRTVLGRLEEVLDIENESIGSDDSFDLTRSNVLKGRCLYDMTLLVRDAGTRGFNAVHAAQLKAVSEKLAANSAKVKAHMDAVREVTDLLKDVVSEAEADGTYSIDQFRSYDLS